jgi:hypothetical protein
MSDSHKCYRVFDGNDKTLALIEFFNDENIAQVEKVMMDLLDFYEDMEGWSLLSDDNKVSNKRYQETYYDGPEDNLHYTNER